MQTEVGKTFKVLIEGASKKGDHDLYGRNDQNKVVIFPAGEYKKGEYVQVYIDRCTAGTLFGKVTDNINQ
jgi:tRNA-2-methylthio-N6-dimethylallyladenosine synthase